MMRKNKQLEIVTIRSDNFSPPIRYHNRGIERCAHCVLSDLVKILSRKKNGSERVVCYCLLAINFINANDGFARVTKHWRMLKMQSRLIKKTMLLLSLLSFPWFRVVQTKKESNITRAGKDRSRLNWGQHWRFHCEYMTLRQLSQFGYASEIQLSSTKKIASNAKEPQ